MTRPIGVNILRRALEEPLRQIAVNAGMEGSVVVEAVRKLHPGSGYDAAKGEYADLFATGIIDPAKVTRSALENASSVASLLLTTETVVTDIPEKEKAPMPGMGGGMDYESAGSHGPITRAPASAGALVMSRSAWGRSRLAGRPRLLGVCGGVRRRGARQPAAHGDAVRLALVGIGDPAGLAADPQPPQECSPSIGAGHGPRVRGRGVVRSGPPTCGADILRPFLGGVPRWRLTAERPTSWRFG